MDSDNQMFTSVGKYQNHGTGDLRCVLDILVLLISLQFLSLLSTVLVKITLYPFQSVDLAIYM